MDILKDFSEISDFDILIKKNEEYFNSINFYDLIKKDPNKLIEKIDQLFFLPLFKQEHLFEIVKSLNKENEKVSKILNSYSSVLKNGILNGFIFFNNLKKDSLLRKTFIENNKNYINFKNINEFKVIKDKYIFDYQKLIFDQIVRVNSINKLHALYYKKEFLLDEFLVIRFIYSDFKDFDALNILVKNGLDLNNLDNKNISLSCNYRVFFILDDAEKYFKLGYDPNLKWNSLDDNSIAEQLIEKFNVYQKNILLNNLDLDTNNVIKSKRKI